MRGTAEVRKESVKGCHKVRMCVGEGRIEKGRRRVCRVKFRVHEKEGDVERLEF